MQDAHDQTSPLTVESSTDLLITLLYAPGSTGKELEPIEGITRLQKLMFLLQQQGSPKRLVDEAMAYGYRPYKMGPYAPQLNRDLEDLKSAGIITTERLTYWLPDDGDGAPDVGPDFEAPLRDTKRVESYRFSLSDDLGNRIGKELWNSLATQDREALAAFKSFFNALSLRQLLIFTYQKFPQYASESTIKGQLGLA